MTVLPKPGPLRRVRSQLPRGFVSLPHACFTLVTAACNFGEISVYEVPPAEEHTIALVFRAEDLTAAQLLGWNNGALPGATVRIVSEDTAANSWRFEGATNSQGSVQLIDIPSGTYLVTVRRMLDAKEREVVRERGITAFLGQTQIRPELVSAGSAIQVPPSERRALVISEFEFDIYTPDNQLLIPAGYIELYNNSDSTIYLDGKVIARAFDLTLDLPNRPCTMFDHLRIDPSGLYAAAFEMFPGSGRDYPVGPGGTVVIAVDAIDHRPYSSTAFDLSRADFEFRGSGDVDNPVVPNMINIGLREGTAYGLAFPPGLGAVFVSNPVQVASLPRAKEPDSPQEYVRFPAAGILDAAFFLTPATGTVQRCSVISQPSFNRRPANWRLGAGPGVSIQRLPLLTLPDGTVVLQHTRSAEADFFGAANTPGSVPPF